MSFIIALSFLLNIFLTSPGHAVDAHDFHISKSILKYKEQEKAIQVSLHLFIDDFEDALEAKGADSLFLCTKMESPKADRYIIKYLESRFSVIVDGQDLQFDYIGKEISEDLAGVWIYLEATEIANPQTIGLRNKLLTEIFNDQKNIMSISAYGKENFLDFDFEDDIKTLQWK